MRGVIQLALLAAVAYFGYTELWPRYQAHRRSRAAEQRHVSTAQEPLACISAAESAAGEFAREILQFSRPPVDTGLWSTFMIRASSRLSAADSTCRCLGEACLSAAAALLEQRKVLNQFDAMVRGEAPGMLNPAASLERIDNLLDRARSEAG